MQLDKEKLKEVEEWAGLLFSPKEIAIVLEIDVVKFCAEFENEGGELYKAVMRGKLRTEGEIRKSILSLAKDGSASAQEQAMKLIEKYNLL